MSSTRLNYIYTGNGLDAGAGDCKQKDALCKTRKVHHTTNFCKLLFSSRRNLQARFKMEMATGKHLAASCLSLNAAASATLEECLCLVYSLQTCTVSFCT